MRSKYEKFWERNKGVALALTARCQLSGNYEGHMKYSQIYLYCGDRLEKARKPFTCVCCGDAIDETDEICQECREIRAKEAADGT
jgi:hypothetical protein